MRLLLIATLALLAPLPAAAQDWLRLSSSEKLRTYVDHDSVRAQGDVVLATEMIIYRVTRDDGLKWGRTTAEYNCKNRTTHFLSFEAFDAKGGLIVRMDDPDQGAWNTPSAGSPGSLSLDYICNISRAHGVRVADPLTDRDR